MLYFSGQTHYIVSKEIDQRPQMATKYCKTKDRAEFLLPEKVLS